MPGGIVRSRRLRVRHALSFLVLLCGTACDHPFLRCEPVPLPNLDDDSRYILQLIPDVAEVPRTGGPLVLQVLVREPAASAVTDGGDSADAASARSTPESLVLLDHSEMEVQSAIATCSLDDPRDDGGTTDDRLALPTSAFVPRGARHETVVILRAPPGDDDIVLAASLFSAGPKRDEVCGDLDASPHAVAVVRIKRKAGAAPDGGAPDSGVDGDGGESADAGVADGGALDGGADAGTADSGPDASSDGGGGSDGGDAAGGVDAGMDAGV